MDNRRTPTGADDSRELLNYILGLISRRPQEKLTPSTSLKSQCRDAWLRTDAYLQHLDSENADSEQVARLLEVFEGRVGLDGHEAQEVATGQETEPEQTIPYPKLQAIFSTIERSNQDASLGSSTKVRIGKRKRDKDALIEGLSKVKRHQTPSCEVPNIGNDTLEPEANLAMLMRRHSLSLHHGFRTQWTCVCQKCSELSVRLSLPPRENPSNRHQSCFQVFFGVKSIEINLQEAKITVKDEATASGLPPSAHICSWITESLKHRYCLHLLLESGLFRTLRPQPQTFSADQSPRTVRLSELFKHQQGLRAGSQILSQKGRRILAVILATTLLPFLETPWVQPSLNSSNIQFFQSQRDGELPDITKPFLAMENAPIISASNMNDNNNQTILGDSMHMIHPNASVLAFGILLCEIFFCSSIKDLHNAPGPTQDVNDDYYIGVSTLESLKDEAGLNYYSATKACLLVEYYPPGESTDFGSASVQRFFYQKVIKPLEKDISSLWELTLENLDALDDREKESCWGLNAVKALRQPTTKTKLNSRREGHIGIASASTSDIASQGVSTSTLHMEQQILGRHTSADGLHYFDTRHETVSEQDATLSNEWMKSLLCSVNRYVDSFDPSIAIEPVRIAILDSGFEFNHPLLMSQNGGLDERIKGMQNFVHGKEDSDIQDEIGHGTHALGLLLSVATCAEIYIARVANQETLTNESCDAVVKAIDHAVTEWNVDIISMSFGFREDHDHLRKAILKASNYRTLMFAAASNDGGNFGRAFPAKQTGVFCIHSTDGLGNPSSFNPSALPMKVNFSLLGQHVRSYWPAGKNGHNDDVNILSGTSVATPIAAGLAASILSFVRQQEQASGAESESLASWLKDFDSMDSVLKSMSQRRGAKYDYITPHSLFDNNSSREDVYERIRYIKTHYPLH